MKITWLGQAGLALETENAIIMIDPYFSDSVGKRDVLKRRRSDVPPHLFDIKPDILIFTHNHLDHFDPETVQKLIDENSSLTVLAPWSVWQEIKNYKGNNNYVLFNCGTTWTEHGISFRAVYAEHSDEHAIGVIINAGEKKYYITGDTLYNEKIFCDIPVDIYAMFLPINGVGNNMNMEDAKRFCERVNPDIAIPIHCGLFDDIDMNEFEYENKIVPEMYKEIENI